ncbi:uncharacterized protein LOC117797109 [Ailuropoda melanoleuca]|uniref:uncharacterized protein LOC117797109 n=1 Tax=Ailuropoda melanoleuca TaxID=9646 RepID=UPI0014944460|nr:uncharacterized protein LOC117797109 [Ailuropoda melanoleuca]
MLLLVRAPTGAELRVLRALRHSPRCHFSWAFNRLKTRRPSTVRQEIGLSQAGTDQFISSECCTAALILRCLCLGGVAPPFAKGPGSRKGRTADQACSASVTSPGGSTWQEADCSAPAPPQVRKSRSQEDSRLRIGSGAVHQKQGFRLCCSPEGSSWKRPGGTFNTVPGNFPGQLTCSLVRTRAELWMPLGCDRQRGKGPSRKVWAGWLALQWHGRKSPTTP